MVSANPFVWLSFMPFLRPIGEFFSVWALLSSSWAPNLMGFPVQSLVSQLGVGGCFHLEPESLALHSAWNSPVFRSPFLHSSPWSPLTGVFWFSPHWEVLTVSTGPSISQFRVISKLRPLVLASYSTLEAAGGNSSSPFVWNQFTVPTLWGLLVQSFPGP